MVVVAMVERKKALGGFVPIIKCSTLEVTQITLAHDSLAPCNQKGPGILVLPCAKALGISSEQH